MSFGTFAPSISPPTYPPLHTIRPPPSRSLPSQSASTNPLGTNLKGMPSFGYDGVHKTGGHLLSSALFHDYVLHYASPAPYYFVPSSVVEPSTGDCMVAVCGVPSALAACVGVAFADSLTG